MPKFATSGDGGTALNALRRAQLVAWAGEVFPPGEARDRVLTYDDDTLAQVLRAKQRLEPRFVPSPDDNKFIRLWGAAYDGTGKAILQTGVP